jgi:hypothetical protein
MKSFVPLILLTLSSGCASSPIAAFRGPRTITLADKQVSEEKAGKFISWTCSDFFNGGKTLVEVGSFSAKELGGAGFVIYDGGNSGEPTAFERRGINLRWDWGPKANFAFVLEPDGKGMFYDFTNADGKEIKANAVFKCKQR